MENALSQKYFYDSFYESHSPSQPSSSPISNLQTRLWNHFNSYIVFTCIWKKNDQMITFFVIYHDTTPYTLTI